jgi:hypothetical protein
MHEPVRADVCGELAELGAIDRVQREQGGGWVVLEVGGRDGGSP